MPQPDSTRQSPLGLRLGETAQHPVPAAAGPVSLGPDRIRQRPDTLLLAHHLRSFARLDLSGQSPDAIHLLAGAGRHLQILVPKGWLSLWVPLSGALDMDVADFHWRVSAREALVWRERALCVNAHRPAWWIGICGSPEAWARISSPRDDCEATPFPHQDTCSRAVGRLVIRLARMSRRTGSGAAAHPLLVALRQALREQQRALHDLAPRCNGRTAYRRRQTLTRLLWVRHLIERHEASRLDLTSLAASANYSVSHLIRCYRDVFGETPSEHVMRLRSERALKLVLETRMPVCEITEALGFESQSAFCRAFKNRYGMTTSEARDRLSSGSGASHAGRGRTSPVSARRRAPSAR
jgi:AraC family transcriptional regulator